MAERGGKLIQHVILPIAVLVAVAMAVVVAFIWFSAKRQDQIALEQSIESVRTAIQRKVEQVGLVARDYSWWNDSFRNLDLVFDPEWTHTNIGFYIYDVHNFEMSFVVDRADRTVYAQVDGEPVAGADTFALLSHGLAPLVGRARAAPLAEPRPATGLLAVGDGIAMVGVSAVTPEDPEATPVAPGPRVVLVYAKRLDQEFLDSVAEALPLTGLRLVGAGADASAAVLPLVAPDGTRLDTLVWEPNRPGSEFLRSVSPSLAIAVLIVTAFTWSVLGHARQATQAVESSEARFRDVADASSDWIWEVDADLRLRFVSERFAAVTGIPLRAVLGRPLDELLHTAESAERWERHREDLKRRRPFRNLLCLCEDHAGRSRTLRVSGKPVADDRGRHLGYRGTATDITAEIEAERRAQYLAMYDPLTELPNRELLSERLEQAIASVGRRGDVAAVLCLDLDRFQDVNDTLGHKAGDLLIKRCAERLQACVRETDTVARIGGDEFAVVQVGLEQPDGAQTLCRRLLETLAAPFDLDGQEVLVTASVGVALIPSDGSIPGRLLQNADIALYRAKEEGRGTFRFFEPEMDARLQERKALERDLRLALARDELELYYQPKVELGPDNRLGGVEALVRWHHPERGLVPPNDFIGVAEETGLILALGEWVLRTACAQAVAWPPLRMAVNISPVQFKHRDLVGVVRRALAESGLEPGRLELEVTEGVLLQNTDAAMTTLVQLKELGVRIAMDDFGTGYSSLSYLQKFPFDIIKIDRSFVRALAQRSDAGAIVRAVVGLGHSLGMLTCAEGVETNEQLSFLKLEGCDEVQGYYFGKPMPVGQFEAIYGERLAGGTRPLAALPAAVAAASPAG
ncbi:MAG TPA: EAL domain-containing protein [Geminicoccaceae bacterium]|nr:EAL domain-containing protein [Geminicoccaceae bacterium]